MRFGGQGVRLRRDHERIRYRGDDDRGDSHRGDDEHYRANIEHDRPSDEHYGADSNGRWRLFGNGQHDRLCDDWGG